MNKEYRIYQPRVEGLLFQISKLNKRGARLGCAPIVVKDSGRFEDEPIYSDPEQDCQPKRIIGYRRFVFIEVSGETPKFNGWSLGAVVEHAEEGNILRKSPECKVELNAFRQGAPRCDHCKALRNRKDTFIVTHDNGDVKMVGSNCIKDFLGHLSPHQFAAQAEIMFSLGEICQSEESFEGFGGYCESNLVAVDTLLAYAACAIRRCGFVSGKREYEARQAGIQSYEVFSTKSRAARWMRPGKDDKLGKDYFTPEQVDCDRAEQAKQYVLDTLGAKQVETLSDFEHNLLTVCKCEAVERRNLGILAYVPEFYARAMEDKKMAADEAYFGTVGKRERNISLTYLKSTSWESQYGLSFLHTFAGPKGERILWKGSNGVDLEVSAQIEATFTVKAHEEFKGHKQTKVNRLVYSVLQRGVAA